MTSELLGRRVEWSFVFFQELRSDALRAQCGVFFLRLGWNETV